MQSNKRHRHCNETNQTIKNTQYKQKHIQIKQFTYKQTRHTQTLTNTHKHTHNKRKTWGRFGGRCNEPTPKRSAQHVTLSARPSVTPLAPRDRRRDVFPQQALIGTNRHANFGRHFRPPPFEVSPSVSSGHQISSFHSESLPLFGLWFRPFLRGTSSKITREATGRRRHHDSFTMRLVAVRGFNCPGVCDGHTVFLAHIFLTRPRTPSIFYNGRYSSSNSGTGRSGVAG